MPILRREYNLRVTSEDERRLLTVARGLGWLLVIWIVVFWRLGYPSFWDPGDEAQYAQASREMLASGDWLSPTYNGQPFFDKPILFYLLQLVAFKIVGPGELGARLVPAVSTLGLMAAVWWLGARLFNRSVGSTGVLMLMLLPATFALSSYGILDMTFTALLFGAVALIAVAALRGQRHLEMPGYALLGLAVLTKGPLAFALTGVTFLVVLAIAPDARRPLLQSRWLRGLSLSVGVAAPWFIYMLWRHGQAFVEGYWLRENVWLFTRGVGATVVAGSATFYTRVLLAGLMPWTPLFIGRLIDVIRGERWSTEERVLWAWGASVLGFFTLSHFQLDHYLYPAAPAFCLLAAQAWARLRESASVRAHAGTAIGIVVMAVLLSTGGVVAIPALNQIPLAWSSTMVLVPIALLVGGIWMLVRLFQRGLRPPAAPVAVAGALLLTYAVVLHAALPEFEHAKPVKELGQWTAAEAARGDLVGAYRMERWNTSWRFYVGQTVTVMASENEIRSFLERPGRHYCLMLRRDFDALVAAGHPLSIVREARGIFVTTGRALTRGGASNWQSFVVASDGP